MSEQWMAKLQDIACGEESILQISMRKLTRPKDDISRLQATADQL
jgi:hypothetical protein